MSGRSPAGGRLRLAVGGLSLVGLVAVGLVTHGLIAERLGADDLAADPTTREVDADASAETWAWRLPAGFPEPTVPADNPMSTAKVELGRRLFYDSRLSRDGSMSCATCHRQELAFTDGRARAVGVTGEVHGHGAMSLANVAYAPHLGWDDPRVEQLEDQLTTPLFGHAPIEMGLHPRDGSIERLRTDWRLQILFDAAFPDARGTATDAVTWHHVGQAIAAFERTLLSGDSAFDRYWHQGDEDALSNAARRGMRLFFSRRLGCSTCHGGFNLSGPVRFVGARAREPRLLNTGLYNLDGESTYPPSAPGLVRHTGDPADRGKFRAPTLRNIAVTAPYMHDGSVATLDEVLDHYAASGRAPGPLTSPLLRGFQLSADERSDLHAFFDALTDTTFLNDPRFGPPDRRTP
ncbi:MAG: MbnH family di-heme enzyme [Acidobacteriota bacterium]